MKYNAYLYNTPSSYCSFKYVSTYSNRELVILFFSFLNNIWKLFLIIALLRAYWHVVPSDREAVIMALASFYTSLSPETLK